jgi:hypothetical protein
MTVLGYSLDEEHIRLPGKNADRRRYILGKIADHNVIISYLPPGLQGKDAAAPKNWSFSGVRLFR